MIRKRRPLIRVGKCPICESESLPDYKKVEELKNFITERGKIIGRVKTGVCAKHQRRLCREIKRARFLALLPFVTQAK